MTVFNDVPSRWRGERLRRPPRRLRYLLRFFGLEARETDADVGRLRDGLLASDPVADAFVEWSATQGPGHGRAIFERVVERGLSAVPDAPRCLVEWFEPLERRPAWLDDDALRVACRTAWRVGTAGGTVLSATALMGGYRSSAVVKPLAMTGALDRMVVRRISETSRFLLDIYESDSLPRFSAGFQSACRVRLMHASVRRSLLRRKDWDTRAWGIPINQTDMAATALEFSVVYLLGLMALGFRFSEEERQALMHLWRYVGILMGADDALLAHDFRSGVRQMCIQMITNPSADADSRALAQALHELPTRFARNPGERAFAAMVMQYRVAVSRFTLGDEIVDDIGLPPARLHPLLALASAGRFGLETLRRNIPGATALAERQGLAMQRWVVRDLIGAEKLRYIPYAERSAREAPKGPAEVPVFA
jgi:hypothetical protein